MRRQTGAAASNVPQAYSGTPRNVAERMRPYGAAAPASARADVAAVVRAVEADARGSLVCAGA
jgi:hypothetical protein